MTIGSVTLSTRQLRESHATKPVLGFLLLCVGAGIFCLLFRNTPAVASGPIVFLVPITWVALNLSRWSAALGTCVSALVFATFLFEPIGQLRIDNPYQASKIGWLLLFGIIISIAAKFVADDEPEGSSVRAIR